MITRRIIAPAALLLALLSGNVGATPVTVTLDNGWWAFGSGWGPACTSSNCDSAGSLLNVGWSIDGGLAGTSFQLGHVGDHQTIRFGNGLFAEEDVMLAADETDNLLLSAFLHFTAPVLGLSNNIAQVAATVGPLKDTGPLNKDLEISFDSVLLDFATGGQISIDFSPMIWNCQGTDKCSYLQPVGTAVDATFTLVTFTLVRNAYESRLDDAAPAAAIPEPSSLVLLGIGLAGLGFGRRCPDPAVESCPA